MDELIKDTKEEKERVLIETTTSCLIPALIQLFKLPLLGGIDYFSYQINNPQNQKQQPILSINLRKYSGLQELSFKTSRLILIPIQNELGKNQFRIEDDVLVNIQISREPHVDYLLLDFKKVCQLLSELRKINNALQLILSFLNITKIEAASKFEDEQSFEPISLALKLNTVQKYSTISFQVGICSVILA